MNMIKMGCDEGASQKNSKREKQRRRKKNPENKK
jgi:hypothetical protein